MQVNPKSFADLLGDVVSERSNVVVFISSHGGLKAGLVKHVEGTKDSQWNPTVMHTGDGKLATGDGKHGDQDDFYTHLPFPSQGVQGCALAGVTSPDEYRAWLRDTATTEDKDACKQASRLFSADFQSALQRADAQTKIVVMWATCYGGTCASLASP